MGVNSWDAFDLTEETFRPEPRTHSVEYEGFGPWILGCRSLDLP